MSLNHEDPNMTLLHATAPISNRVSQPSSTYFIVLHPDQLSERSHPDNTGYGSTSLSN